LVPFSEGFTVSESSVPFLEGMYGRILTADEHWCEFYVLYRDGEPITCGTIQTCFGLSVIYNVATIGSARGQGAATALVVELMRLLKERGCAKVALFAEKSIQPLYSRLGFVANESSISIFGIWNAPASW
jgi:citrate lyase synthetase